MEVVRSVSSLVRDLFPSDKFCYYRNAAALVGTVFVGHFVLRELCGLLNGFRAFFLAPLGLGTFNLKKYGNWAVVTGASEGIGKAYALELAKRGLNVVLMSRSEEKLNKVATEIKEKFNRDTRVIPVDFADGYEVYGRLAKEISSLDIGVLVNNVGMFYEYPDLIGNVPPERLYKVVQINCQPAVQMSRILLPKMTAKEGGVIVNISSSTSIAPLAQSTVYSATKVFMTYLSDGLRKEYGRNGIIVQNVVPFLVATALNGIEQTNFMVPSPSTYVKAAVATIGIQDNTFGSFSHALQGNLVSRMPVFLVDWIAATSSNQLREDYLRKKAKEH